MRTAALPVLLFSLSCSASPYAGNVFLTGILDADPSEAGDPLAREFNYKAIEFFSNVSINPVDAGRFALRSYPDSLTAGFSPSSDIPLDLTGIGPETRFYAVRNAANFLELYESTAVPNWSDNNGGPASIVYQGEDLLNFDGNEVYQLVYYPNGIGNLAGLEVLDTFGQVNYLGAPFGSPDFSYDNSWAYRVDFTSGTGATYTPSHWIIPGPGTLSDLTFAQTTGAVPFGTYILVPEATTGTFFMLGGIVLARRFRRRTSTRN